MRRYSQHGLDFIENYRRTVNNSLQFENICENEDYGEVTAFGLRTWDCELLTTYLPTIIERGQTLFIRTEKERKNYERNPQRVSMDTFGSSEYWYLILAMNGYTSRFEFTNFGGILLVPVPLVINELVNKIERERIAI
jgi:hypothetical protein